MSEAQPLVRLRYVGPLAKISTPAGTLRRDGDTWGAEGEADWPADIAATHVDGGDWMPVEPTVADMPEIPEEMI